ncbi:MAG: amidophosphoribosyltransferase [Candidatus Hydrothermarchaeales archaeon]
MMLLREKCGVVGFYSKGAHRVSSSMFYALFSLQHRGQESCGITTFDGEFHTEKGMGLVPEVFDTERLERLPGSFGIGHVRYSTTGDSRIECAQPFVVTHSKGTLAIAHNGNLVNALELRKKLEDVGQTFVSDTDTEVIANLIIREFVRSGDIVDAITEVMKKMVGSYSLVLLTDEELIAVRDPLGIKPLCMGGNEDATMIASESVSFDVLDMPYTREVNPGEIVVINENGVTSHRPFKLNRSAYCMFEYVYFARADSVLNGIPVYNVRERIGKIMGNDDDIAADFVTPVPDSAIPFALGYSRKTGIPYKESLIRNRYVGRTFILPNQQSRELAVRLKLNPLLEEVKGKRVVLFDDSIVRGTTSGKVIRILKRAGASEVHMRVGCPPIKSLCKLGIDMPTDRELIASDKEIAQIQAWIGADSLKYLTLEGLTDAIGLGENELCLGCLTEQYPVEISKAEQVSLPSFVDD